MGKSDGGGNGERLGGNQDAFDAYSAAEIADLLDPVLVALVKTANAELEARIKRCDALKAAVTKKRAPRAKKVTP